MELWMSLSHKSRNGRWLCFVLALWLSILSVGAVEGTENVYHCHNNQEMKIALTFDDGPHPVLTPKILEILRKYQIKATFFVVGENVHNYPDTVLKIISEGHELGNHTYSHNAINQSEIEQCEKAIYELAEYKTKLFRPPQGHINQSVKEASRILGYDIILWDIDTRDWDHAKPKIICNNVIRNIKSGSIILMHDYIGYHSPTPEALDLMIPTLLEKGYRFVVVSELIGTQ